jgi:hypothetical protein
MRTLPFTLERTAAFLCVGATLLLAACDDGNPVDPVLGDGEYRLEVEGDIEDTLTGEAFFGADEDESGTDIFAIMFGSESSDHLVMVGVAGTTRPATGTYTIEESGEIEAGDWVGLYIIGDGDELESLMVADSGTVVLTRSDTGAMTGSVLLYMSGLLDGGMGEVVVEGDFDARTAPTGS